MSSGLSKKKSAPALLLCSSPSDAAGYFEFAKDRSTYLRKSRSAPSLAITTKGNLLYREMLDESIVYNKKHQGAIKCDNPRDKLVDTCANEPAVNHVKTAASIIINDIQQQFADIPPSHLTSGDPLKSLRDFSNQLTLSSSISSSTGFLLPLAAENTPQMAPKEDTNPKIHPPPISKRLSSRCLQTFQKLRPRSVFYPDYRLSISNTNENRFQNLARHPSSPNSLPSRQTSVVFTAVDWSSEIQEVGQKPKPSKNRAINLFGTSSAQRNSLGAPSGYSYLLNKEKAAGPVGQEITLQHKPTDCMAETLNEFAISPGDSSGDAKTNIYSCKKKDSSRFKENHDDEISETRLNPMELQSARDTETLLDFKETLYGLKSKSSRVMYKKLDAESTRIPRLKDEGSNCPKKESERELEGSTIQKLRLATWKHRKSNTFSSSKTKFEIQLEEREKETATAPHMLSSINSETAKLKKSSSLLFRLWDSIISETSSVRNQTQYLDQRSGGTFKKTDQKISSRSLQANDTSTTGAKKDSEQILQKAKKPMDCGIINNNSTENKSDCLQPWQVENAIAVGTPGPNIFAGELWKRNKFRGSGKELKQDIIPNKITVDDSSESRKQKGYPVLSPDFLSITYPKSPALEPAKRLGVSWNRSIQEYAGSLGHVRHSGQRAVSDTFRSGSSDFSRSGFTEAGIPTLGCLKNKTGLSEEPSFEESSLAADWDIAMRMMEEFSKADRKLKRTGAIKVKRSKGGPDPEKNEAGRSFSDDSKIEPNGNKHTRPVEPTPEVPEDDESDDSSAATSIESLGYESSEEVNGI